MIDRQLQREENDLIRWKPDIGHPCVCPRKKVSYLRFVLMRSTRLGSLHDFVLWENSLISGLMLYPAFLYPVSSVIKKMYFY